METLRDSEPDALLDLLPYSKDLEAFGAKECFDASQYSFFGRAEEVELGGLDEDDNVGELDFAEEVGEAEEIGSLEAGSIGNEINDLASSFMKVNTMVDGSKDFYGHLDAELGQNAGDTSSNSVALNWRNKHIDENQYDLAERKTGRLQKKHLLPESDAGLFSTAPLSHQQQHRWGLESNPLHFLGTSPIDKPQYWHGQAEYPTIHSSALRVAPPGQYKPSFSGSQHQYGGVLPSSLQYGRTPRFGTQGSLIPSPQSRQWMAPPNLGDEALAGFVSGMTRHPMPQHGSLMSPQVLPQYQRPQIFPPVLIAPPYTQVHHQQGYSCKPPPLKGIQKFTENGAAGEFRAQQHDPRGRRAKGYQQSSVESNDYIIRSSDGLPQMSSKYMTVEEVENIVRIQWAATHNSDPYVDDYYHQAVQAKLAGGTPSGRCHFAPSHLRDLPSHTRAAAEPHAFLQVDALGRIPFSSFRTPRPLLEMDTLSRVSGGMGALSNDESLDIVSSQRRLKQEPMLAARIAIEDGLYLLLDVDDIDRLLKLPQASDSGLQLQRRRQILLEGLAVSLHMVDPLALATASRGDTGRGRFGLAGKDDLIFLRLVSLPKGRKLVAKYLRLIVPGSELGRIVAIAVFRHLRFLFGGFQTDPSVIISSNNLANAVACLVLSMDLPSLSSCLATVVLASEPPPLRPIGNPAGDGATVMLQAVLEQATTLLKDHNSQYPIQNRAIWQASFDNFFVLLSRYCTNKYESIFHSLMMALQGNVVAVNASAASAMAREMPIELLRASIPHTDEHQRKQLLELARRSIAVGATCSHTDSHANVTAVRS